MELVQLVADRIEEASRPLREEVASLKLLLARVGDSLELSDACASGGQSTEQKSSVVEEEHLFGCFSPRGNPCQSPHPDVSAASQCDDIDGILNPVLLISPELHELCGESSVVLPLVLGSFEALAVATTPSPPQLEPCQSLDSLDSGGVLAPNSDALVAKEICGLLASLEVASPGFGKDIACVLAGRGSEDIFGKVEKSLRKVSIRSRRRKRGVARKASTAD
jgi:hypothetical protein